MVSKEVQDMMKKFGYKSVEEIDEAYKKAKINIGFFTTPIKKKGEKNVSWW